MLDSCLDASNLFSFMSISKSLNSINSLFKTYFCSDIYYTFFYLFIDAICCKALVTANPLIYIYHVIGQMVHNCLSVPYVTLLNIHDLYHELRILAIACSVVDKFILTKYKYLFHRNCCALLRQMNYR